MSVIMAVSGVAIVQSTFVCWASCKNLAGIVVLEATLPNMMEAGTYSPPCKMGSDITKLLQYEKVCCKLGKIER